LGNTLKMEKQALIKQLIEAGYSDRKINGSTGLNRRTMSAYRKKFKKESEAENTNVLKENGCENINPGEAFADQNAPEKCPRPPKTGYRSHVAVYDKQIREKLGNGQYSRYVRPWLFVMTLSYSRSLVLTTNPLL